MSGVLWVETNHSWDEEMMIQINPIGSPNYLKRNITPDFELNDLLVVILLTPTGMLGREDTGQEKDYNFNPEYVTALY